MKKPPIVTMDYQQQMLQSYFVTDYRRRLNCGEGGFGHDNYRKHAPFFGGKSTIFAQTFGFVLYLGQFCVFFDPTFGYYLYLCTHKA